MALRIWWSLIAITMFGCAPRAIPARVVAAHAPQQPVEETPTVTLASFADELALSLEPSKLEDETTATAVFVFNRGSRTWTIALNSAEDGTRSIALDVHDVSHPDRALPPAPIGITAQCPRAPERDVVVIGPGERGLLACVEKLVDVHDVEEIELAANLRFVATDGSEIRVVSPAFRVARRPIAAKIKSTTKPR